MFLRVFGVLTERDIADRLRRVERMAERGKLFGERDGETKNEGTSFMAEERDEGTEERTEGKGYTLSDELDENGIPFIISSDGSTTFGEIGAETGLTPAPIKLSEGELTNPATKEGYGYIHIDAKHGEEIRNAGFDSVEQFASYVIANYDRIMEGKEGLAGGKDSYLLQVQGRHNDTLYIELSNDGSYWEINSGGVFRNNYGDNRKEVYNRHATAKQSTENVEATQNAEQSGTQANSRMNTPTPLSEGKGSENSGTSKENAGNSQFSAEERAERAGRVLSEVRGQKQPGASYDTAGLDMDDLGDTRFSVGERRRTEMDNRLKRVRPDLTEGERNALFDYLGTLTKPNGDNDTKLQNATFNWFAKGAIRIPEDMEKVRQAVKLAERFGADTSKYDTPMELIDTLSERTGTDNPIDPDTVPTLSNKVDYGNGITVYDVDESEESRWRMRGIIDTHLGKDRNPWCLLQGDGEGNLTEESKGYWYDTYNKYPKRVAFRDGKLMEFFASNGKPTWWDTNDKPHDGLAITRKMDDGSGRTATYEYNEGTGEMSGPHDIHKGNRKNGTYEEWYDNGQHKLSGKFKDGREDGLFEGWYENGQQRCHATYKDGYLVGTAKWWHPNGVISTRNHYNMDGVLDGLSERWYENGVMRERGEYKNGRLIDSVEKWYANGNLQERQTYKNGVPDGYYARWRHDGTIELVTTYKGGSKNGVVVQFDDKGNVNFYVEETNNMAAGLTITEDSYNRNGPFIAWENDKYGNKVREFSSEEAERLLAEKTAEVNAMLSEMGIPTNSGETKFSAEERDENRIAVRNESGFTMTERERRETADYLMGDDYASELTGNEFPKGEKKLLEQVTEFYNDKYNGKVFRDGYGDVILDKQSVRDSMAHGLRGIKAAAFAAVPDIIKRGSIIDSAKNWKGRGYDSVVIAAPLRIGRGGYIGVVVLKKGENANNFRFYLHKVNSQKSLLDEQATTVSSTDATQQEGIAKVLRNVLFPKNISENVNFSVEERELSDADTGETVSDIENPESDTSFSATERVNAADEARERLGVELTPDELTRAGLKYACVE